MTRSARWGVVVAILIALGIGGYIIFFQRANPPSPASRLDPTRPIVEVQIPLVNVEENHANAFVLPEEIVVPPRATVRIKGKFRTGSRKGGSAIIGEARVPSSTGKTALLNNGMTVVRMRENSICEFEVLMHFPKQSRSGILVIRLKDEFLATGRFRSAP